MLAFKKLNSLTTDTKS